MALSLELITTSLLTIRPTIDNLVTCYVILDLESEIGEEFLKVQKNIEKLEMGK
jgi:hypothetical protein